MIKSNSYYSGEYFDNLNCSAQSYTDMSFDKCIFKQCNFSRSELENCDFRNCIFDSCDFSLLKSEDSIFSNAKIKNSNFQGMIWSDLLSPFSVQFEDTDISYCSFYGKLLKNTKFINCNAEQADFSECDLSGSDFSGTNLKEVQFNGTKLNRCDLVSAVNYRIDIRNNTIDDAKFSFPEALSFLDVLDIDIVNNTTFFT
ncbi:pentapeptide repeat-containing protein [Flavobacterium sp. W1B]|uniref:pentapeptide repeat-containing protein n=1 Tax=Flavobacterium sp. W1B TaxID=3394146 RepID=UPI0039BD88D4